MSDQASLRNAARLMIRAIVAIVLVDGPVVYGSALWYTPAPPADDLRHIPILAVARPEGGRDKSDISALQAGRVLVQDALGGFRAGLGRPALEDVFE